jgi:hypothetical protein
MEESESVADVPLSQSLEAVTRKLQIKTKGKVLAVVRESYLRNCVWTVFFPSLDINIKTGKVRLVVPTY